MWYLFFFVCGWLSTRVFDKCVKVKDIYDVLKVYTPSRINCLWQTLLTVVSLQTEWFYLKYIVSVKTPTYLPFEMFEVDYYHKNKQYRIILSDTTKKHVCINAIDENGQDITERFLEYFGPEYNFHGQKYTPKQLGYKNIIIVDENFTKHIYDENEIIL